jgi:hypothetical protein
VQRLLILLGGNMNANIEQIQRAITEYFNQEILSKTTGLKKFTTDLAFNLYKPQIPKIFLRLVNNPLIKGTGVIDENNLIDVDTLYEHAKNAIQHSGQIEFMGILFNDADVDKLYTFIKNNI